MDEDRARSLPEHAATLREFTIERFLIRTGKRSSEGKS
jgi:hypothetical protein